jgi:hypothetical protein
MYVVKRDGRRMPVAFDKITARVKKLSYGLDARFCDPVSFGWWKRLSPPFFKTEAPCAAAPRAEPLPPAPQSALAVQLGDHPRQSCAARAAGSGPADGAGGRSRGDWF